MKNGKYEMVLAPEGYPGKRYRDKYAYEHHVVWWTEHGFVPSKGREIHHLNGDHRDNRISNLQLLTSQEHKKFHCNQTKLAAQVELECPACKLKFSVRGNRYRLNVNKGMKTYCSRKCQYIGLRINSY